MPGYCKKCRCKWTGLRRSHCSGCHQSFNSVGAFDRHRTKDFKCLDPLDIGLELNNEGYWREPMSEELKRKFGYSKEMASQKA